MSGIIFCPVCEKPLNEGMTHCPYCGARLHAGDMSIPPSRRVGDISSIRYTSASQASSSSGSRDDKGQKGRKRSRRRKFGSLIFLVLVFLVLLSVFQPFLMNSASSSFFGILSRIPGFHSGVEYPRILLSDTNPDYLSLSNDFNFQDELVTISYLVDRNLYTAASNTGKNVILYDNVSRTEWEKKLYQVMIGDPGLEQFYESVLAQLRYYAEIRHLDRDEYLELIACFVQSVPYSTDNINTEPKYPVETVYGNRGDCDDKSLLLAGLLSREGYDVVLFLFEPEEHMTVGVHSDECPYPGTGYAIIETTSYAMVGWEEIQFEGLEKLYSTPLVIPIGNGTIPYTACDEVSYIHSIYSARKSGLESLKQQIVQLESKASGELSELNAMGDRMSGLKASGNYDAYNSLVSQYNSLVDVYNSDGRKLKQMADDYNNDADLINAINERQYDRPGLYLLAKNS